jgi:predicted Zn-ribbon and HTH transcriptional regulator
MSEMGDMWREIKQARRERREKYGQDCPGCVRDHPKRIPSILLPGQRCRVCGFVDKRERIKK